MPESLFRSLGRFNSHTVCQPTNSTHNTTKYNLIKGWMNVTGVSYDQFHMVNTRMQEANCVNNGRCCLDAFNFWDNFELAAFSIWRSDDYRSYFDYLDKQGEWLMT